MSTLSFLPYLRSGLPLALAVCAPLVCLQTVFAAQAALEVEISDLATDEGNFLRVHGSIGNGALGVPVAGGFDCDDDGHRDFAMASFLGDPLGRDNAGELYLVFGDGTISGTLDTAVDQERILRIIGDGTAEAAGSEVWMDDVTGDGVGDLLIARQNFRPDMARPGAGALTILVGGDELRTYAATLATLDLRSPPVGLTLFTLVGESGLDRLGIWMRTGDVTGDGIADIVVGADQRDGVAQPDAGAAYVIRGGAHLATTQTVDLADFGASALDGNLARVLPPSGATEYHFGATCQIADLDDNGTAEVLVAAALNRSGATLAADGAGGGTAHGSGGAPDGAVFIAWDDNFTGNPWADDLTISMDSPPGTVSRINGASQNVTFGEEIVGGVDFDDDGSADLFIGDIVGNFGGGFGSGSGHVIYDAADVKGLTFDWDDLPVGLVTVTIAGGASSDIAGDTAGIGDFDGDGIHDLALSAPHADPSGRTNAGTVYILHGRSGPWPETIDLAPGSLPESQFVRVTEIYGANGTSGSDSGDVLSYSAATGDIDNDGKTDFITNEMQGNGVLPAAEDVGNLVVISGKLLSGTAGPSICGEMPLIGCRVTDERRSKIQVRDRDSDGKDRIKWKWDKGEETLLADFGDPVNGDTHYGLCLYDSSASTQPLMDIGIPPGGFCGTKPCWRSIGSKGLSYKNRAATPDGIAKVQLRPGEAGDPSLRINGKGAPLPTPTLPLTLPVTVQFLADEGNDGLDIECWEAVFTESQFNEAEQFKAAGP